jgi:hypothetical protein
VQIPLKFKEMANRVFEAIFNDRIESFKFTFQQSAKDIFWDENKSKLIHPSEYGKYRESACKEYLRLFVPLRLDISEGFLITANDLVSTQLDVVIYDKNSSPLIENNDRQRFFPIETVVGIGEVKSDLTKDELKKALNKLARNKGFRKEIKRPIYIHKKQNSNKASNKFDPIYEPTDSIFSFLICNKLAFNHKNLINELDDMYEEDIQCWQKHNAILSFDDGVFTYFGKVANKLEIRPYPCIHDMEFKDHFVPPRKDSINWHFYHFSWYLYMASTEISTFRPSMARYLQ